MHVSGWQQLARGTLCTDKLNKQYQLDQTHHQVHIRDGTIVPDRSPVKYNARWGVLWPPKRPARQPTQAYVGNRHRGARSGSSMATLQHEHSRSAVGSVLLSRDATHTLSKLQVATTQSVHDRRQPTQAAYARAICTVAAHRLWDVEEVVDVACAGWLWEVVISARGDTVACTEGRQMP